MITEKIRNPLSLFDVRDKVAIITGASGSFGHACAVALGALGAKLLLASGTAEELETVVKDVAMSAARSQASSGGRIRLRMRKRS